MCVSLTNKALGGKPSEKEGVRGEEGYSSFLKLSPISKQSRRDAKVNEKVLPV